VAFFIFAIPGAIWAYFFFRWFRDDPRKHKDVNAAELALLPDPKEAFAAEEPTPWGQILRAPSIWLVCLQYFCQGFFFYFMTNWMPTYLREARGLSATNSGVLSGLPLALGGLGCLAGGQLLRACTARFGARASRRGICLVAFASAAGGLLLVPRAESGLAAALMIGVAAFSNDLAMAPSWITCTDLGGRFAGTVTGLMNTLAAFGGVISPALVGYLYDRTASFDLTFKICAAIYAAGFCMWFLIDPVTPVARGSARPTTAS
jgi:cyanate permease